MVLVDTSVWVSHFRHKSQHLEDLLSQEYVYCHPFIIAELACGHLSHRNEILGLMHELPMATPATDDDALVFIEKHHLIGRGLGMVDVYLLASASLSGLHVWSEDKKMCHAAHQLRLLHV